MHLTDIYSNLFIFIFVFLSVATAYQSDGNSGNNGKTSLVRSSRALARHAAWPSPFLEASPPPPPGATDAAGANATAASASSEGASAGGLASSFVEGNSTGGCAGGQPTLTSEPPVGCTLVSSLEKLRKSINTFNASGLLKGREGLDAAPAFDQARLETLAEPGGAVLPGAAAPERPAEPSASSASVLADVSATPPDAGAEAPKWEAFVVTLRRRTERLRGFVNALAEQEPWVLERLSPIWAVDGKMLAADKVAKKTLVSNGFIELRQAETAMEEPLAYLWWDLSPGAIGCYLSHAMAWEQIVKRGLDYGLVFEDDTRHFAKGFGDAVKSKVLERKGANGDIVYLQHCDASANWPRGSEVAPVEPSTPHILDSDLIVPCTAAYMISQKAARQLLRYAFPLSTQLDRALAGLAVRGLTRMRFEPALAQVGKVSEESDIQDNSAGLAWLINYMSFKFGNWFRGADGDFDGLNATSNGSKATLRQGSAA
eukprot:TRINITY_DN17777_c0_g1_i2.p1 TRINITY_DN17777_c0_g1~~TRINITY_DN17777_c0_g1_i2.p1  ORF type:complete len:486 (+),score=121.28 TRINITY_DN17777_c0_g1_i2:96-1553(+)